MLGPTCTFLCTMFDHDLMPLRQVTVKPEIITCYEIYITRFTATIATILMKFKGMLILVKDKVIVTELFRLSGDLYGCMITAVWS